MQILYIESKELYDSNRRKGYDKKNPSKVIAKPQKVALTETDRNTTDVL